MSRSRDRARFTQADSLCYRDYTRSSDPESRTLLLSLAQPCEMNIFRKQPAFPPSIHSRYNNVTRASPFFSLSSSFFFFFWRSTFITEDALPFFFPLSPREPIQRGISVKIFATIFTSFQIPGFEKRSMIVCIYIYIFEIFIGSRRDSNIFIIVVDWKNWESFSFSSFKKLILRVCNIEWKEIRIPLLSYLLPPP